MNSRQLFKKETPRSKMRPLKKSILHEKRDINLNIAWKNLIERKIYTK